MSWSGSRPSTEAIGTAVRAPQEIQEVFLYATVYCGAPAGIDAFRATREVIEEWQAQG